MPNTVPILGFDTTAQRFDTAIKQLRLWSQDWEQPRYISFCAAYTLTMGYLDMQMRRALEGSAMLPADGMPLVWLQHWYGQKRTERVYAPDVMEILLPLTVGTGISHYFYGGEQSVTEKLIMSLSKHYHGLQIAGYHAPPFAPLENAPNPDVIERINAANPNMVWVGLGSVKQDLWMAMYRPYLKAPLLLGVGAAFNFLSGTLPQAPKWMQKRGLEWLFRLAVEPRRLAKRYLLYNPIFVYLVLHETIAAYRKTK